MFIKTNSQNFKAVMRILILEIIVGYAVNSIIVECWKPQIITDEIFLKWIRILKKWFKIAGMLSASQLFESFSIENVYFDGIALIIRYGIWFTMSLVRHVPFGVVIAIYLFLNAKVHLSTHEKKSKTVRVGCVLRLLLRRGYDVSHNNNSYIMWHNNSRTRSWNGPQLPPLMNDFTNYI